MFSDMTHYNIGGLSDVKYTAEDIEQILKDYRWMLNTVKTMRDELKETDGAAIAQYGIDSVMPKGKGDTGDVVFSEVMRRNKQWERIESYEARIRYIQSNVKRITAWREAEVLHWLLEGKSNAWIANHMMLSHTHIKRIIRSIAQQMV